MTRQTILEQTLSIGKLLSLLLLIVVAAGCDGTSQPEVVATYPRRESVAVGSVVREAEVEVAVHDAGAAAERVARLAVSHGGTVVDTQRWTWQGREQVRVTASVPAAEFASFYRGLLRLGTVISERVTEVVGGNPQRLMQVVVTLRTSQRSLPPPEVRGWRPAETFRAAFAVFTRLFQGLVDGLIWLAVVAGPFVLMLLGLATLVRRMRGGRDGDGTG